MLFVGIDVSKSKHSCYIIDFEGTIYEDNLQISNNIKGFNTLSETINSICKTHDLSNVKIGLESTGYYSTNIKNYLHFKGFEVILFNPMITNSKRKSNTLRKTKTDKTDAKVIAMMLLTDNSKSYSPISYQIIELKSLTRFHHRIVNQRGKDKAIELKQLAAKSIGSSNRATAFEIQTTNNLIHVLDKEIKVIDQKIKTIVDEINTPLITIPGISYTLAAIIIAEIGDINRFANPAKLLAYSGLDPSVYQSGQYNATHTRMVKRGSKYLRWAILQAVKTVAMRDKTFKDYLNKKLKEGKHYFVALSHAGKKLIRVIFYLLKNNTTFVPQN